MLTDEQYDEMARLLVADIRALIPLCFTHNSPVSEANIRLMAVLMRRWLVDGDLQKLLAPLRLPILFNVQANSEAWAYAKATNAFSYFLTAGVRMNGQPVTYIYDSPRSPAPLFIARHSGPSALLRRAQDKFRRSRRLGSISPPVSAR